MRDTEIVASIMAGDSNGLAAAYDRYADPLFKYCRSLLGDPADAADAVQDTFLVTASRLEGLREPERFRAWLYAVARNESLKRLRSKKRTSALDEAPDVTDDSADVGEHAQRAELRALFEDATAGLNPGEREVIELQLRQGLEAGEVATVLGVSRNHAHTLLSRARDQLEACLGVLLVGRAGRRECGELGTMLAGWDGRLTVLLRKRVHRHIEHCPTCAARRAFELRPAMLLDLSPGAAMAAGAAESLRLAFGAPPGLRADTIALATGHGPAAVAHSTAVLNRAGDFGKQGFPRPAHAGGAFTPPAPHGVAGGVRALRSSPRGQAALAAAVVIAVASAAVAVALTGRDEHFTPSANPKPPTAVGSGPAAGNPTTANPTTGNPTTGNLTTGKPAAGIPATGRPSARKSSPATTTMRVAVTPAGSTASPVPPRPAPPAPAPASTGPAPARSPAGPVPSAQPSSPARAPTPGRSSSPPPPPAPAPPPPPGRLSVLPDGGTMLIYPGLLGSLVSLHASGGAVHWSVSVANDQNHVVSVSPAGSGTLTRADPAITLTVRVSGFVRCGPGRGTTCPSVTISPGGATFAVRTGWTLPLSRASRRPPVVPASTATRAGPAPGGVAPSGTAPAAPPRRITMRPHRVTRNYHPARTKRLR
jgi:RNA polymerase sigma factor (sigma-70 family)